MGWKASTIIINKPAPVEPEKLLHDLGFANLKKIDDKTFDEAINPDDHEVYVGKYKDNLLICAPDLPMQFFEDEPTEAEKALTGIFPSSEMCAIVLHSTVNLWGYAVLQNGKKIRARAGSSEDGTFVELGEPLEEEKALLSQAKIDKDGQRTYTSEVDGEEMTEDQVGENFVFAVCKRYFGEELDRAGDTLFETKLTGYSYSVPGKASAPVPGRPVEKKRNRWLLYGIMVLILIAWQILKRTLFK